MRIGSTSSRKLVVGEAADGRRAIAMARALRPDVCLLDIRMPDVDGIEATRSLVARGGPPVVQPMLAQWLDLAFADNTRIDAIVAEALAELPTDQRDAVVVVDMLRCTVAEACHLLNARPGTIKSRCSRGRAKLSVLLAGVTLTD